MEIAQLINKEVEVTPPSKHMPYTIRGNEAIDVLSWGEANRNHLNELLLEHGAILLRGFQIEGPQGFNELFKTITSSNPLEYKNRTSPREKVYNNVYTSTSHPKDQMIHMHTENSYSYTYNRLITFYCLVPPGEGGETPIADERRITSILDPKYVEKFRNLGVKYVRNTIPGVGLSWKTIFQTEDHAKVNEYLTSKNYDFEWVTAEHLRLKWVLPAFQTHPITGQEMWFNHMYFGHKSLYHPAIVEFYSEENLPFATYYGDGSDIEDEAMTQLKQYYQNESIVFKWHKNDFLLLDNMMFSHGRKPFKGDRTILTAMGEPKELVF